MQSPLSIKVRNVEESQTFALAARAARMKREGRDIISLTAGEPDFPTPRHVKAAAVRAIEDNFTHYTANEGIPELREAICEKFLKDNGLRYSPADILVSNGAKHSISNALQAICNPGDEVLILSPYWVSYPAMVRLADAIPVIVPGRIAGGFRPELDLIRESISPQTKALILNSPGNPGGFVASRAELDGIASLVHDSGMFIISDEIYEKIVYDGCLHYSIGAWEAIRDQVITVNGLSKAYAMTGWRIGYMGGPADVMKAAARVQSQTTSNPNSIAQKAALAALTGDQQDILSMRNEFERRRDIAVRMLGEVPGVEVVRPQGAFYVLFGISAFLGKSRGGETMQGSSSLATYLLERCNVAVMPGIAFGVDGCLRISYACATDELNEGLKRIASGLRALQD